MAIPTTKEMIAMFNKVNADCMRDGADAIPFSDEEYYAEQIGSIYEVSWPEAHNLAHQLREATRMRQFEINGFTHVTREGVIEFWKLMDSMGTIGMLWDITSQQRADALMMRADFDMTTYINEKFNLQHTEPQFDEIMIELHEELCDAIFTLEYANAQMIKDIHIPMGEGKSFLHLDCIPSSDEWNQVTVYPQAKKQTFQTLDELALFAMENIGVLGEFTVRVDADIDEDASSDCQISQSFKYTITGAGDHHVLESMVAALIEWGYAVTFTRIK